MENKLTIEHLAPYLPYGLIVENLNCKCDYVGVQYSKLTRLYVFGDNLWHYKTDADNVGGITDLKPLLIPLSELTQDHVKDTGYGSLNSLEQDIINKDISVELWLDLIKNHWDVHSLIDQGLALNKLNFK